MGLKVTLLGHANRLSRALLKMLNKRLNLSEGTILSHNIVVNHKLLERINRLTAIGIYGLWLGGLTIVVFKVIDKNPEQADQVFGLELIIYLLW